MTSDDQIQIEHDKHEHDYQPHRHIKPLTSSSVAMINFHHFIKFFSWNNLYLLTQITRFNIFHKI
jgi:hypothetical protein